MIAFNFLLMEPAEQAGIEVPESEDYDPMEYPHWHVFGLWQLGRPMPTPTAHWDNAKIIAKIPEAELRAATVVRELMTLLTERGCV